MAGGAAGSMGENLNMHTVDETLIFMWLKCEDRTSRTSRGPGGGAREAAVVGVHGVPRAHGHPARSILEL